MDDDELWNATVADDIFAGAEEKVVEEMDVEEPKESPIEENTRIFMGILSRLNRLKYISTPDAMDAQRIASFQPYGQEKKEHVLEKYFYSTVHLYVHPSGRGRFLMTETPDAAVRTVEILCDAGKSDSFEAFRNVLAVMAAFRLSPHDRTMLGGVYGSFTCFSERILKRIGRNAPSILEKTGVGHERRVEYVSVQGAYFAEGKLRVKGDATQLSQAIYNLALNAIQAVANHVRAGRMAGRGRVEIRTGRVKGVSGKVYFEVADEGPGMDQEVKDRLFQPFVTTKNGGVGLGLSIVRRIVKAHAGTLEVESPRQDLQLGARFRIVLPEAR